MLRALRLEAAHDTSSDGREPRSGTRGTGAGERTATALAQTVLAFPGDPLHSTPREFMERRLGSDFSQPGVHTDARAAESARAVGSRACAVGRDVVFAAGQYAPRASAGTRLLAHELANVVQQSSAVQSVIRRETAMHPDPGCGDLLIRILARLVELGQRADEIIRNPLNLPQSGPMSVGGHQQQFRNKQTNLRRMLQQWDTNNCGPGYVPRDAWNWATRPAPSPAPQSEAARRVSEPPADGTEIPASEIAVAVGAAAATVGAGYIIYRIARMLPSLLPPLWWTIPANVAVP